MQKNNKKELYELYEIIHKVTFTFNKNKYAKFYGNGESFLYFDMLLSKHFKNSSNDEIYYIINFVDLNFSAQEFIYYWNLCDTFQYWEYLLNYAFNELENYKKAKEKIKLVELDQFKNEI